MESGTFSHDGIVFHYDQVGGGNKHVVLQHGFSDYALCWGTLPDDLKNKGYKVVMMDARGHGRSGKPDERYDLTTMAGDMLALIRHLNLIRPVVIGHSMGASMAARAAADYPELIRAAILIDPVFQDVSNEQIQIAIDQRTLEIKKLKQLSHFEILEITRKKHPEWPEKVIEFGAMGKIFMSTRAIEIFNTISKGWKEDLKNSSCPILLITADQKLGAIISVDTSNWIRENFPNVEILYVPKVGHSIHREKYSQVFNGVLSFLSTQY